VKFWSWHKAGFAAAGVHQGLFPTGSGRAKGKVTQTHRRAHTCSHPDMVSCFALLISIIGPFCLPQIAFVP